MSLDLFQGNVHLGSVVRSRLGTVYAYTPAGEAVGQFHDIDAAAVALAARLETANAA